MSLVLAGASEEKMNTFETILLQALLSAEATAPAFISSGKSVVYLNASEEFVNSLVQAGLTKSVSVPASPATPAA